MIEGFRFVWPYSPQEAFFWDETQSMLQASPEFILRVQNIRSYTMAHDFLEEFPEFRGEAPQLEPSATLHEPSIQHLLEDIYWTTLRRRDRRQGHVSHDLGVPLRQVVHVEIVEELAMASVMPSDEFEPD